MSKSIMNNKIDRKICFESIGWVENQFNERTAPDTITAKISNIFIREDLVQGLQGLKIGSQILVIFHFDRSQGCEMLQHPRGDKTRPKRGVFALRSPNRPNAIGATMVDLVAIDGNMLTVRGLDAINNTPVIDIKPG